MKVSHCLFALCIALSPSIVCAQTGKVVRVLDGDTLSLLTAENEQIRVRLLEIDAPEKNQAFGNKSKQALISMCAGKKAELKGTSKDRYGRTLAHVYCDGQYVNKELVKQGMAWVYRRYSKDPSMITEENEARESKRGLWRDPNPVPPWEFRRR